MGFSGQRVERDIPWLRTGRTVDPVGYRATVLTDAVAASAAQQAGYVLHVVPANGGGVDRYVRDICAHRPEDCILHVVPEQSVFEAVAAQRFIPIDDTQWLDSSDFAGLGYVSCLHAHSTLAPVRECVAKLRAALDLDYVLTLHDIDFAGAFGVVDDRERQARLDFVGAAAQRIVPSVFIAAELSNSLSAAVTREVIENGVNAVPKSNQLTAVAVPKVGKFDIAVVGALGPHKGLNFLLEVVAALPPELRVVVIGYADGQVTPGWLRGARLWVHGAFEPDDLAAIIRSYGVRIAFFPNRQPESYSYALSDVWRAGLPALGPAAGAIGDRLSKTGAGWIYGADSSAPSVATTLRRCLRETATRAADVAAAATALPATGDMVQRLNQQYEKIMMTRLKFGSEPEVTPRMKTLETLAATQLNARFFRGELTKLSGDLVFSQAQAANADQALRAVTRDHEGRGRWIAELEASISGCKAEIARIEAARLVEHEDAEAARLMDRSVMEAAREHDRVLMAAAREQDRALSEAARQVDREQVEAARLVDREQVEAARQVDREQAEAVRLASLVEQAAVAEAARLASFAEQAAGAEAARLASLAEQAAVAEAVRLASLAEQAATAEAARLASLTEQAALAEAARITAHNAHVAYADKLQKDVNDTLAIAHRQERTLALYERALSMFPPFIRRRMLARAERLLSVKDAQ